jgi:glycosyltransferase involved in cell wall biosynthesis
MNELNGLDILAEAFVSLKKRNAIPRLKLKVGGGYTGQDKRFLKKVRQILKPYADDVELCDDYSLDHHAAFYRSVSVICAPLRFEEGVGLYLCEAFAAGRPAVVPATGSFPEIVGEAGLLYQPNNSEALADALQQLFTEPGRYAQAVRQAEALSAGRYNDRVIAESLMGLYTDIERSSV